MGFEATTCCTGRVREAAFDTTPQLVYVTLPSEPVASLDIPRGGRKTAGIQSHYGAGWALGVLVCRRREVRVQAGAISWRDG